MIVTINPHVCHTAIFGPFWIQPVNLVGPFVDGLTTQE